MKIKTKTLFDRELCAAHLFPDRVRETHTFLAMPLSHKRMQKMRVRKSYLYIFSRCIVIILTSPAKKNNINQHKKCFENNHAFLRHYHLFRFGLVIKNRK